MFRDKKKSGHGPEFSPFVPLVLFILLCILLITIGLLKEFKKDTGVTFHTFDKLKPSVMPKIPEKKLKPSVMPKIPEKKLKPSVMPKIPEKTNKLQVALIIDDIGWNKEIIKNIEEINRPLTLSIFPKAPYSKDIFNALKNNKTFELILHLPMEPIPPSQSFDKGLLKTSMSDEEIIQQFDDDIKGFYPRVRGLNNHMGSLFTSNEEKMSVLLKEMKSKNMFFVDSMTSRKSKGYLLAKKLGLKTAKRDVFLDNEPNPEYIEKQIWKLVDTAKKQGRAVGIGHAKKNTIDVLENVLPEIEKEGIEIVPVSSLLE